MPKRSLSPGREIDRLNRAVEKWLQAPGSRAQAAVAPIRDAQTASLLTIVSALRSLPRQEFKETLKKNLERSASMATTLQPPHAARTSAAPRLIYKSAAGAIAFYEKAFGAKESFRFENEGGIGHAEIMIGDTVVMLGEEWPEG